MKRFLFFILILVASLSDCQAQNRYEQQITYQPLNKIDPNIQLFMQGDMQMHVVNYMPANKGKTVVIKYMQNAFFGKGKNIYFRYDLFIDSSLNKDEGNSVIRKLTIDGDDYCVTLFYAKYWNTTINSNDKELFNYYNQDKASLRYNKLGHPVIIVSNTSIKDIADYFKRKKSN